jgi:hypothetical protein
MRKEITICDKCKKEVSCEYLFVKEGRKSDAAGQMEDYGQDIDICHTCSVKWLSQLINS